MSSRHSSAPAVARADVGHPTDETCLDTLCQAGCHGAVCHGSPSLESRF